MTVHERVHRVANFTIMLGDTIEKKMDFFERRLHKAIQDELIDLVSATRTINPQEDPSEKK